MQINRFSPYYLKFITNGTDCCSSAEGRLLESLGLSYLGNQAIRPLLVVTYAEQPVGIVKNCGEVSCYGLTDLPQFGIIKGAFSAIPRNLRAKIRNYTSSATAKGVKSIAIEKVEDSFRPVRFSVFSIPVCSREDLYANLSGIRTILTTDSASFQQQADSLLAHAEPFEDALIAA